MAPAMAERRIGLAGCDRQGYGPAQTVSSRYPEFGAWCLSMPEVPVDDLTLTRFEISKDILDFNNLIAHRRVASVSGFLRSVAKTS